MSSRLRLAVPLLAALALTGPAPAEEREYRGAQTSAPVKPTSVDVDLRDLPVEADWQPGDPIKEIPRRHYPRPGQRIGPGRDAQEPWVDPLLAAQEEAVSPSPDRAFTSPILNFAGQNFASANPPDTVGDVGPNHYIQMVNTNTGGRFTVYDKSGTLIAGPSMLETLGTANCAAGFGDGIVLWDSLADRWLLSEFSSAGNRLCVYVSKTADPVSGGWWAYNFQAPTFPDYPKYAVMPDAYYVGTNETSPAVYALDRAKMLNGQAATFQRFTAPNLAGFSFQMLIPADLDGATVPGAGTPGYFMRHRDDEVHNAGSNDPNHDFLEIWTFHVDWATPSNSIFTGPIDIAMAEIDSSLCGLTSFFCFPQPGNGTPTLDPLREVVMHRLQYRVFPTHVSLVGNLVTDVNGADRGGIRWFELRETGTGTWTLNQQGTYSPDATNRWMGSAAMDKDGNLAVGYSVSSTTVFPGIRYAGRLTGDPAGSLPQGEATIKDGTASNASNRWGDYAALSVDPSDDCTFWFTTMYNAISTWSTQIATFKFDSCGAAQPPDFSVSASPSSVTVTQGTSANTTVTVASLNGFNSAVSLSASGLPSGVTASFSPASVTPPANGSANSTLTLTASATAATGTVSVTISGVSGPTTRTATVSLTVNPGGSDLTAVFDATLQAPRCATVGRSCDTGPILVLGRDNISQGAEPNQPNTINDSCADGASGRFHFDESNDRVKVVSVDGTNFAPGKAVRIEASVWAWTSPNTDKLDLYYAANANSPAWTFITTLTPTLVGAQTLSATYTLPAGNLQAVRAQFRYQGAASACTSGGFNDHDDLVFAVSGPPPDFSVSASPSSVTVTQGTSANTTVTVASLNGFSSAVGLSASALPSGVTASFSPASVTPPANGSANSTLSFTASTTAEPGTVSVTVSGVSGSTTRTATVSLTIQAGDQTAAFDATLQAPKCGAVGRSCDTGPALVLGRDSISGGLEPNQPNTINDSCADGTTGTFHSDESIDRLKVSTTDGTALHSGKTVRIDATVWAWTTPSADHLDLYYAANANSPVWTLITTLTPTAAGAQTLSTTYTLPAGFQQAVRAQFRYLGAASACTSGGYNDHDDLIFVVEPVP